MALRGSRFARLGAQMALAALIPLALAACDAGPSAVATSSAASPAAKADPRVQPVRLINGRPMWAPNRRNTAEAAAEAQFRRNGADFGAASAQDYVAKTHAFVAAPPAGSETLTRSNGDRLIYDAASNTFAVVASSGAPRTMFKPRDGAAYWRGQLDRTYARTAAAKTQSAEG